MITENADWLNGNNTNLLFSQSINSVFGKIITVIVGYKNSADTQNLKRLYDGWYAK